MREHFPCRHRQWFKLFFLLAALSMTFVSSRVADPISAQDAQPSRMNRKASPGARPAIAFLYQKRCQRCHSADGSGGPVGERLSGMPNFTDQKWQKSRTDTQLALAILDGAGVGMPGFRGKINDAELDDLVSFIRALGEGGPGAFRPAATSADFNAQFRQLQDQLTELQRQFQELAEAESKEAMKEPPKKLK
jgi:mono/diheme cytochrome c family protein